MLRGMTVVDVVECCNLYSESESYYLYAWKSFFYTFHNYRYNPTTSPTPTQPLNPNPESWTRELRTNVGYGGLVNHIHFIDHLNSLLAYMSGNSVQPRWRTLIMLCSLVIVTDGSWCITPTLMQIIRSIMIRLINDLDSLCLFGDQCWD